MLLIRVILLLPLFSFTLFAKETIKISTIGISPYGIESEGGVSGVYFELANQLFDSEIKIEHTIYPYARIIHELKTGQTDLTIMFKYDELKNDVVYIASLPPLKNVVVGISGSRFKSIKELEGKRIAYLRGASFSKVIENNNAITLYKTTNFTKSVEMLKAGRVEAVIGPLEALIMAAKNMDETAHIFGTPLVVSERTPWLQASKKAKHLNIQKLKSRFMTLLENDKLEQLKKNT